MEPREALGGPKLIKEGDRFHSHGINFNHNMLTGPMESLPNFVRMTLMDPNALTSLDLSFNVFTEIPKVRASHESLNEVSGIHSRPLVDAIGFYIAFADYLSFQHTDTSLYDVSLF